MKKIMLQSKKFFDGKKIELNWALEFHISDIVKLDSFCV